MNEDIELEGNIKKIDDKIKEISRDYQVIERSAILHLVIDSMAEEDLRRLQRACLYEHPVVINIQFPQGELMGMTAGRGAAS